MYDYWTQRLELVLQTTCLIFDVIWLLEWRYIRSSFVLDANLPEHLLSSGNTYCCPSLQHCRPTGRAGILCSGNWPLQRVAGSIAGRKALDLRLPLLSSYPLSPPPSPYHRSICVDSLRDTEIDVTFLAFFRVPAMVNWLRGHGAMVGQTVHTVVK